jgi:dihydrofolate reductase
VSRKFIVCIAASADGYIARADGSVDWLDRPQAAGDYGLARFYDSIDTILWGRVTYEGALKMGGLGVFGARPRHYVFSRRPPDADPNGVTYVREPLTGFLDRLRAEPGRNIWVMGGAGLIGSLLDASAIDEFDINVIPVLIGEGIPLIQPRSRTVELTLLDSEPYPDGVVRLHYRVGPPA